MQALKVSSTVFFFYASEGCRVKVQEGQRSGGGQRSGRVNVQEGQHSGEGQRSGGGQRSGRGQHCGGQDRVNILGVNI